MGLRQVARTVNVRCNQALAIALLAMPVASLPAAEPQQSDRAPSDGAQVRITTYETESGDRYFAASIQPSADKSLMAAVRQATADVAIIVDTSATQAGDYRDGSIAALRAVVSKLRDQDRVRIFAGDVRATDLTGSFDQPAIYKEAIKSLAQRLPLGNTNLMAVIDSVRASLVAEPQNHSRSIVYIGDGSSIDAMQDENRFGAIVDALRADRIAVHSIAIGPANNVELMAVLANQTGGVVGIVGDDKDTNPASIGRQVGSSAIMSPIWLDQATLISGMTSVQHNRLPPLRLDRDSILLGRVANASVNGSLKLSGSTSGSNVSIVANGTIEPNHPDFGFLAGLVKQASDNDGLRLPTAGSTMLRETARVLP